MADPTTAAERLQRLLYMIPAASVEGGVTFERLAADLDVDVKTVVSDLTEVLARAYYHPAGSGDDIQIHLGTDHVRIWTKGSFQRPVKLSPREAFCLALGLRCRSVGAVGGRPGDGGGGDDALDDRSRSDADDLLARVEAHLAARGVADEPRDPIRASDAEPDPRGLRDLLVAAARDRVRCRIAYLKPEAAAPEERVIHPYEVVHAEGRWYVIAWCETYGGGRAFRLDRMLDANVCGGTFERRLEFDVGGFLEGGRVYDGGPGEKALVRYSPRVARWIAEWASADAEPQADGSLVVRHDVSDPGWLVRHVARYGGEAEVLEPLVLREHVGREVAKLLAG